MPTRVGDRVPFFVFVVLLAITFVSFCHPDLVVIARLSESLYHSPFHFYETAFERTGGIPNYPLPTYFLFALLLLPLKIFGLVPDDLSVFFFTQPWNAYLKLILVIFAVGCAYLVKQIAETLGYDRGEQRGVLLFFLTSPFVIFNVAIFSHGDGISLFFALLGIVAWLRGRSLLSGFSLGACLGLKVSALLVPLNFFLRWRSPDARSWKRLGGGFALGAVLLALTSNLFPGSGKIGGHQSLLLKRMFDGTLKFGDAEISLFGILAMFVLGLNLYFRDTADRGEVRSTWLRANVFSLFLFAGFFSFGFWHPQWILLAVPAIAFAYLNSTRRVEILFLDVLLFVGYVLSASSRFPSHMGRALVLPWARQSLGDFPLLTNLKAALFRGQVPWTLFIGIFFFLATIAYLDSRDGGKKAVAVRDGFFYGRAAICILFYWAFVLG